MKKHQVVIVGGGSGGLTVAAHLRNTDSSLDIAVIEPSEKHYYQPLWTLVGAGVFPKEETEREEEDFIPDGVTWIKDAVASFAPEENQLETKSGETIGYDYLILSGGIQINWDAIPGLKESIGKNGVCSNYSYETVESTWENIRNLKKGVALFTQPNTPIKCGGAPQKICYLAEDYFRKHGVRDDIDVTFVLPPAGIFGVAKYAKALDKVVARKGINTIHCHHLVEIKPDEKVAVFEHIETKEKISKSYDMIHVTPPQGPMDFLSKSPFADEAGWVDVDQHTLQHTKFSNVFGLGDCTNTPNAKTGAAIRKQAPVVVQNLLAVMNEQPMNGCYDGYTSCPLVTGYGSLILAEFKYGGIPAETFPFNQAEERYSMYALKAYALPRLYWHGMLRGRA